MIETDRLRLRPFSFADAEFIIELLNSDGWLRYIGDRNVHSRESAEAYLANGILKNYATVGYGFWAVELISSGEPIGMCGLIQRDTLPHPDIGFAFLPEYIGQGYGYEAAAATLEYAFDTLKMTQVLAITVPENESSIRLLEKIGLQYTHTMDMNGEALRVFST